VNSYRLSSLTNDDIYNYGQTLGILDKNWHLIHRDHYGKAFQDRMDTIDWRSYRPATPDLAEFTKRTGHQIEDMLLMCRWRDEDCGPENFTHIYTNYGNCYTFNSGQNGSVLLSKKPGRAHGLNLYLNLEEYDYLNNEKTVHAGFKILLHHRKEPPLVDELGLGLQPETHYLVAIRKELASIVSLFLIPDHPGLPGELRHSVKLRTLPQDTSLRERVEKSCWTSRDDGAYTIV
jgi:hypothetical protein